MRATKGFTITELLVVIFIIALLASLSTVSISAILSSSEEAKVIGTIGSYLAAARAVAQEFKTTAGVRIEPKSSCQIIRTVAFGIKQSDNFGGYIYDNSIITPEELCFRSVRNNETAEMSDKWWVAPDFSVGNLNNVDKKWNPANDRASSINAFETFYILFGRDGRLRMSFPLLNYLDETQPYDDKFPITGYPFGLARGFVIYDREKYLATTDKNTILNAGLRITLNPDGSISKEN